MDKLTSKYNYMWYQFGSFYVNIEKNYKRFNFPPPLFEQGYKDMLVLCIWSCLMQKLGNHQSFGQLQKMWISLAND